MTIKKLLSILFFTFLAINGFAGNPALRGTWQGFLKSNTADESNKDGLPVSIIITDDNDAGDVFGEMNVSYRYQTDIYRARYKMSGNINYSTYQITIKQEDFIYSDLLPKGLKWCSGSGTLNIYRSSSAKKLYMDGFMKTNCGEERLRLILIKM